MSQPGWLGSLRVAGLYFAGVIFGSLAASVVQPTNYLVGASAGVYALIAAHLGETTIVVAVFLVVNALGPFRVVVGMFVL